MQDPAKTNQELLAEIAVLKERIAAMEHRTEEALQKSEEFLGRLIAAIPDMVVRTDVRGDILFINDVGVEMSGYGKGELIGTHMLAFIAPEDRERAIRNTTLMMTQRLGPKEYRLVKKDGTRLPSEVNGDVLRTVSGDPCGMVYVIRDVGDRKRAEEALRESESKYRILTEKMTDVVWITDMDLRNLYVSPSIRAVLGFSQEERMGQIITEQLTPDSLAIGLNTLTRELALEKDGRADPARTVTLALEYCHKDGSTRWMETIISGIRNETGVLTGLHGLSRDITTRRQAEQERDRLQVQLNQTQRLESIGTLAGGIAHDFNNLLMGIQGYASLTLLDLDPSHPHHENLKRIEEQVQSGAELTRQLLGFARGGKYEIKPADLNEILQTTSSLFSRTKKEIAVHHKFGRDLWIVEVDRGQMEQVLLNLYVNAWHAMPGGGEIYLETENVSLTGEKALSLALEVGEYVKITVTDTGTGMDRPTQERIFDPFFTTKAMGKGTGLGLATVYGIIKGHKGMIHVESDPGQGTAFTIHLPASEKQAVREKAATETIVRGTETILLVDDEPLILDVGRRLLEFLGYRVYPASSGPEAIALYRQKGGKIDLVLLDMVMPGLSGGEVFDQLRQIDPEVRVLLSSGYSIDGQAQRIIERGCRGFLQKPFQVQQISRKVREILD
jgi:PAS domain S-box-containing protein